LRALCLSLLLENLTVVLVATKNETSIRIEFLGENPVDDVAVHVGEADVAATKTVGEFLMI
jgi:hypothetical protein